MSERRVVIMYIEGGVEVDVKQPSDVDVHVIDLDTDGADAEALCDCALGDSPHFHAEYPGEPGEE